MKTDSPQEELRRELDGLDAGLAKLHRDLGAVPTAGASMQHLQKLGEAALLRLALEEATNTAVNQNSAGIAERSEHQDEALQPLARLPESQAAKLLQLSPNPAASGLSPKLGSPQLSPKPAASGLSPKLGSPQLSPKPAARLRRFRNSRVFAFAASFALLLALGLGSIYWSTFGKDATVAETRSPATPENLQLPTAGTPEVLAETELASTTAPSVLAEAELPNTTASNVLANLQVDEVKAEPAMAATPSTGAAKVSPARAVRTARSQAKGSQGLSMRQDIQVSDSPKAQSSSIEMLTPEAAFPAWSDETLSTLAEIFDLATEAPLLSDKEYVVPAAREISEELAPEDYDLVDLDSRAVLEWGLGESFADELYAAPR